MYTEYPKFRNGANLYLYCVRERQENELNETGIFNQEKVFAIGCENLEAIVSAVPEDQFDATQIKKKAQEDVNWIKDKAQHHETIVEKAMYNSSEIHPVIPMRFGTIFKSKEKIIHLLTERYNQYKDTLACLTKKQEWSVKVYLADKKSIIDHIVKTNELIKKEREKVAALPKGMAYFMQNKLDELVKDAEDQKINEYRQEIVLNLKKYSTDHYEGRLLGPEFTGKKIPMILNAILLIHEDNIPDFIAEAGRLKDKMKNVGFQIEFSGPWPPYHFVESR